jgi:hypothetical protein
VNEFDNARLVEPDAMGNRKVEFTKRINGSVVVIELERGKDREQTLTMWIRKNGVARADDERPLGLTSETTSAFTTDILARAAALRNAKKDFQCVINSDTGEPYSEDILQFLLAREFPDEQNHDHDQGMSR